MTVEAIKDILPASILRLLGQLRSVARRIRIWLAVRTRVVGVEERDQKILARAIRRAPITVWQHLKEWQFPMVEEDCTVLSRGVGLFNVRARTDDLFHALPGQEPAVEQAIRNALRPGDTFVDAGSNIGYYTILSAGIVGEKGTVIACEMMPDTARILRENVALNGVKSVIIFEGALSDKSEETVHASYPVGRYGQASIACSNNGPKIAVRTRDLEAILEGTERVRVMKLDLEGAELNALYGLGAALAKIEWLVFENQGAPEVVSWLEERGFDCSRLDRNNVLAQRKNSN